MSEKKMFVGMSWMTDDEDAFEAVATISDDEFLHIQRNGEEYPIVNMHKSQVAELVDWLFDHGFLKITAVVVEEGD